MCSWFECNVTGIIGSETYKHVSQEYVRAHKASSSPIIPRQPQPLTLAWMSNQPQISQRLQIDYFAYLIGSGIWNIWWNGEYLSWDKLMYRRQTTTWFINDIKVSIPIGLCLYWEKQLWEGKVLLIELIWCHHRHRHHHQYHLQKRNTINKLNILFGMFKPGPGSREKDEIPLWRGGGGHGIVQGSADYRLLNKMIYSSAYCCPFRKSRVENVNWGNHYCNLRKIQFVRVSVCAREYPTQIGPALLSIQLQNKLMSRHRRRGCATIQQLIFSCEASFAIRLSSALCVGMCVLCRVKVSTVEKWTMINTSPFPLSLRRY